jgi:hypothetical protein
LAVWSQSYISVLKSCGKEDHPIVVTGVVLEYVFRNLPSQSQILLMPETPEVQDALKPTRDIVFRNWDGKTYCNIPQWQRLIETSMTCGSNVQVRQLDEEIGYECAKMRMLAIWEAQEAMMNGVSQRDNGPTDFLG